MASPARLTSNDPLAAQIPVRFAEFSGPAVKGFLPLIYSAAGVNGGGFWLYSATGEAFRWDFCAIPSRTTEYRDSLSRKYDLRLGYDLDHDGVSETEYYFTWNEELAVFSAQDEPWDDFASGEALEYYSLIGTSAAREEYSKDALGSWTSATGALARATMVMVQLPAQKYHRAVLDQLRQRAYDAANSDGEHPRGAPDKAAYQRPLETCLSLLQDDAELSRWIAAELTLLDSLP